VAPPVDGTRIRHGARTRARQVGFVTSAEPGPPAAAAASPTTSDGLSPVMIPPVHPRPVTSRRRV
jgi:hypothetical protein